MSQQLVMDLLNNNSPFNQQKVRTLDLVTNVMYGGINELNISQVDANNILQQLKSQSDFWLYTDFILEYSQNYHTKLITLIILEEQIKSKWLALHTDQQNGIRCYMMNMIITLSQKQNRDQQTNTILQRANSIIVQIVKYEWNTTWKDFIPQICGSSINDMQICENNLHILKLLSEEIFDFSKNQMTSKQINELKMNLTNDFKQIYDLCYAISKQYVQNPQSIKTWLMKSCIDTLYAYLSWIPFYYIFQTDLIDSVLVPLIDNRQFGIQSISCCYEIANIKLVGILDQDLQGAQNKLMIIYSNMIQRLNKIIPSGCNNLINDWNVMQKMTNQSKQNQYFEDLCRVLFLIKKQSCLFFTSFFSNHIQWIELMIDQGQLNLSILDFLQNGLQYIVEFSQLPDEQIYRVCIEFWHSYCGYVVSTQSKYQQQMPQQLLLINATNPTLRANVYPQIFNDLLKKVLIQHMAKPEEVLITTDDEGNAVQVLVENTENNSLYELMKELLISLSILNWPSMKIIMDVQLESMKDKDFSFDKLNCLCWAIGSISGHLPDDEEKGFFIKSLKTLLTLVEQKKGKDNKATIAANIMYLVGQFPRFLQANWSFLKTVSNKLFEFMKETFPGVMEMSVNTFLKIAKQCKLEFIQIHDKPDRQQKQENEPFINDIIRQMHDHMTLLENKHRIIFYESIGHIISAQQNSQIQQNLMENSLNELFIGWKNIITQGQQNPDLVLREDRNIQNINFFLKVNQKMAFSIGHNYNHILSQIFYEIISIYVYYSEQVQKEFQQNQNALNYSNVKKMRTIKQNILNLIETYVSKTNDPHIIAENYGQSFMQILHDYGTNLPDTREAEVLTCFATIIEKLNVHLNQIPIIFDIIFNSTLIMITQDFNSYPDHRLNFFAFLKVVIKHAFNILFSIPPEQFRTMFNCLIWAMKHELPNIFDIGLDVIDTILQNVNDNVQIANQFYQLYYMILLKDLLYVLTDSFHKNGFKMQTQILRTLFLVVETGSLLLPLSENQTISNKQFVHINIVDTLSSNFINVSKQQTDVYVSQLFSMSNQPREFKTILRDYLVQLSHFQENEILYEKDEIQNQIQ